MLQLFLFKKKLVIELIPCHTYCWLLPTRVGFPFFAEGAKNTPFQAKHQMRDQVSMHVSRVINLITNFIHVHLSQVRFQVTELAKFDKDDHIIILISLACFSLYRWKRCAISVTCFFCSPSEASQEVGFNFARLYDECPSST